MSRARFSRPGTSVPLHVWVPRERVRGYVESARRRARPAPVELARSSCAARPFAPRGRWTDGGSSASRARARIRVALKTNYGSRIPLEFVAGQAEGRRAEPRPGGRHHARAEQAAALQSARSSCGRSASRPGEAAYPTPLGSYEIVTMQREPVVVSAAVRLGSQRGSGSARPGEPAGHALDGDLRALRRHPRHAGCGVDRLLRVARLRPHAHLGGRVAVPAGEGRDAGLHRPQ